jgi:hypothetical protein
LGGGGFRTLGYITQELKFTVKTIIFKYP